jgi:tetratricopeptide (TPR) repeat protein
MTLLIPKGQIRKGMQECSKQVEKSPKDKRLRLKLGDLYLKNGDDEKAIKEYLQTAELYAEEDLNNRAIAIYKRVVSINPKHIQAFRRMATLYSKDGLCGSAKACYERILQIRPGDEEAMKALSVIEDSSQSKPVQEKTGKEESLPIKSLVSTSSSIPSGTEIPSPDKDLELHYHLGIGYKEMGLFDYAITEFELASEDPSIKFECYIMLGECFREKGDSEQSIKYFEWASKIAGLPKDLLLDPTFKGGYSHSKT